MIATPASIAARTARPKIDARDRAAGAGRKAPGEAQREGRALEPFLETRREQADDARRPCRSRNNDRGASFFQAQGEQSLRLGLRQSLDLDLLADPVQPVEFDRDRPRLDVVRRGQEPDAQRRVADPSARVDARADNKAQMVGPRRSVGAGDVEQGGEPRTAALPHDGEPLDHKGAVEPHQRHDVGDRRKRDEIKRGDKVRAFAAVPDACFPQRAIERDERHVDDPRGAKITEPGQIVLTVGVNQRYSLRQHLWGLMVIEHDHVEAKPARDLERLAADGSAIDGHHERCALRRKTLNRLNIRAIAPRSRDRGCGRSSPVHRRSDIRSAAPRCTRRRRHSRRRSPHVHGP